MVAKLIHEDDIMAGIAKPLVWNDIRVNKLHLSIMVELFLLTKENNYKVLAFLFILYWHHNCVTDALLMQFY